MRYLDICSGISGRPAIEMAGLVFGRLTVTGKSHVVGKHGDTLWDCVCECGRSTALVGSVLRSGKSKSCGCLRRERAGLMNRSHGRSKTLQYELLRGARRRSADLALPFDLTMDDIVIPDYCPALGIPIDKGASRLSPGSPTLDRIIPSLGYVVGNIAVISWRANKLKNNTTPDELARLSAWLSGAIQ